MFKLHLPTATARTLRLVGLLTAATGLVAGCAVPMHQSAVAVDTRACLQDPLLERNSLADALIKDPADPGALFFEGLRQELSGHHLKAREHYGAVVEGERDQAFTWECEGIAYRDASLKQTALDRLVDLGLSQEPAAEPVPSAAGAVEPMAPTHAEITPLGAVALRGDDAGARALGLPKPGSIATPMGVAATQASARQAEPAAALEPQKEPAAPPAAVPEPSESDQTPGEYTANFASYRNQERAHNFRKALMERYPAELTSHETFVRMVDLGSKGLFYRVGARGFTDRDAVLAFCSSISGQDCIPMVLK